MRTTFARLLVFGAVVALPLAGAPADPPAGPPATAAASAGGLQALGSRHGLRIGTGVKAVRAPQYWETAAREFNVLTPGNAMKWDAVHPREGVFDFSHADGLVSFARKHGMRVRGHTLTWHRQNPAWLSDARFSRERMIAILREHVDTVVRHFKVRFPGTVYHWDVVNEPISACSPAPTDPLFDPAIGACRLRPNLWQQGIGDDYVALALRFAHEADPAARLFVNEYGAEGDDPGSRAKRQGLKNLVASLRAAGVPVHGVGFQFHVGLAEIPSSTLGSMMAEVAALGVEVAVTELDVGFGIKDPTAAPDPQALAQQARVYRNVLDACLATPACRTFVVWGFSDAATWLAPDQPCLFDKSYRPKPAYVAVRRRLLEDPARR